MMCTNAPQTPMQTFKPVTPARRFAWLITSVGTVGGAVSRVAVFCVPFGQRTGVEMVGI